MTLTTPRTELGCQYSHDNPGYAASIYTTGTLQIRVDYVPPNVGSAPDNLTTVDQACTEAKKILDIITPVLPDHT